MIVPTLCVGMHPVTLRVTLAHERDAERPGRHSHAEHGNDRQRSSQVWVKFEIRCSCQPIFVERPTIPSTAQSAL
ncbi:hypothetical protein D8M30_14925 [Corynebacterium pseudodiphtheriticum]|nr:hypothetical protein D8M30_14925 [Corynebacterium pseudodiphtheriticum]